MDVPCTVRATAPVFVSFPQSTGDNDAASTLLHEEVGMWVALGGDAPHLTEAVDRLTGLAASGAVRRWRDPGCPTRLRWADADRGGRRGRSRAGHPAAAAGKGQQPVS